jgi:hypothetical protein
MVARHWPQPDGRRPAASPGGLWQYGADMSFVVTTSVVDFVSVLASLPLGLLELHAGFAAASNPTQLKLKAMAMIDLI